MSKPDELQDEAPKFDFTAIPFCGIDDAESTTTLFEDDAMTLMTREPLKEHALEVSDKVAIKYDASIFGGDSEMTEHGIFPLVMQASDDVSCLVFIPGEGDEMVEHEIFLSTIVAFRDELRDLCHHIERESAFITSRIHDDFPEFPYEESHNSHHLSQMSDSTICDVECTYFEGVSKPPRREIEVVDRACAIYDDTPVIDNFVPPFYKMMVMV
ncbi:Tyrosyl-tRNA synthetase [Hordeum vulgare]|nr:Tyrosyl-tRNA synthetase [Hordeum vulgare]